ncbi:MAG: DUF4275 family protein, partial [Eubacterium sp.]|nr:DUF4275 family protein [Eubacterium sp.]
MFKRGKWEIEIDEEKTKEYYASLPVKQNQSSRNFRKCIELFTDEERAFFDAFCIDLTKLDIEGSLTLSPILKKKREWDCNADFFYYGKVISAPSEEDMITIEDVTENGLDILDERDDSVVTVGRFEFEIQNPEDWEAGDDWPEGALYISMSSVGELEWLLEEKCEDVYKEDIPVLFEIKWGLHRLFIGTREEKKEKLKLTETLINYFDNLGIHLTPMSHKHMLEYKKLWVSNYTDNPEIAKAALPSKKTHNLLWHVFSFEEGKAIDGDEAQAAFDNTDKKCAVIYIDDIDTAFTADNISTLNSIEIEHMCTNEDIDLKYM